MARKLSPTSEYIKIRRYVMNLIYRSGNQAIKIPTLRELSEQFSVSRPTVIKALRNLQEENLILARPHLGTFTNPAAFLEFSGLNPIPTVGILIGDGLFYHYNPYFSRITGALMSEFAYYPAAIHLIQTYERSPEALMNAVEQEKPDVLIWISHFSSNQEDIIQKLQSKGQRIIMTDSAYKSVSNVHFDYYTAGYELGKRCIARGLTHPITLYKENNHPEIVGFQDAMQEVGVPINPEQPESGQFSMEFLKKQLEKHPETDVLFTLSGCNEDFLHQLEEMKPDFRENLTLILPDIRDNADFNGFSYEIPMAEAAHQFSRISRELMKDRSKLPQSVTIAPVIREIHC